MHSLLLILAVAAQAPGSPARCDGAPTSVTPFAPNLADSARLFRGTFSADGGTLYYFRKVTPGQEDYRIYVSRLVNGRWTDGLRLDLGGDFSDLYPSVSADGKRLVFASYRPAPGDTSSHRNAYLWYAERQGEGWGPPQFIAAAAEFGTYHSGPLIEADYAIRFARTSADWRTKWQMITRWSGRGYTTATADEGNIAGRWRDWRKGEVHIWGGRIAPSGDVALLDISPLDPATRRRGPTELWVSLRRGAEWTEPVPAGGGVNGGGTTGFVTFHPGGCEIVFVRDYTSFQRIGIEALLRPARRARGP